MRLIALTVVCLAAGVGLSLRDLVLAPRSGPLEGEGLVLLGFVLAIATVGWFSTQALGRLGLVVAPLGAFVVIAVALVAKQLRYPAAPLTGDGFEILLVLYVAVSLGAAAAGLIDPLAVESFRGAVATASVLIAVATVAAGIPYVLRFA